MQRVLTGPGLIVPSGASLANGKLRALPVGVFPYDSTAQELLTGAVEIYELDELGALDGFITAGASYEFTLYDAAGVEVVPPFVAGVAVTTEGDPITYAELYESANAYTPPGLTVQELIDRAIDELVIEGSGITQAEADARYSQLGHTHANVTTVSPGFMAPADKSKLDGVAPGATVNASDAFLRARDNHTGEQPISTVTGLQTALNEKLNANLVGQPNGVAELGPDGKLPTSRLASIATTEVYLVASEAAMLALGAQRGDFAVRSDFTPRRSYILAGDDPGVLADWIDVTTDQVVSTVNGQTGNVVITAAGLGAALATDLGNEITARQDADALLDGRVGQLESDVIAIEGDVAQAQVDIDQAELNITQAQADIDAIEVAATALTSRVTVNEGDIAALDTRLDAAEADVTALEAADVSLDARLDTAESKLAGIETGARKDLWRIAAPFDAVGKYHYPHPGPSIDFAAELTTGTGTYAVRRKPSGGGAFAAVSYPFTLAAGDVLEIEALTVTAAPFTVVVYE